MGFSRTGAAAWECLAEGGWVPFDATIAQQLEAAFLAAQPIVRFKRGRFTYEVGLAHLVQLNTATGRPRPLRRCPVPPAGAFRSSAPGLAGVWEWQDEYGVWQGYDPATAQHLRECPFATTVMNLGPFFGARPGVYEVDLHNMTQTNRATGLQRPVRCCAPALALPVDDDWVMDLGAYGGATAAPSVPSASAAAAAAAAAALPAMSPDPDPFEEAGIEVLPLPRDAVEPGEQCPICLDELFPQPDADGGAVACGPDMDPIMLSECKAHGFHRICAQHCIQRSTLKCPVCSRMYGRPLMGTQPDGTMDVQFNAMALAGHEGCQTAVLTFVLPSGIQGPEHPQPGHPFLGTRRQAFLPMSDQGRRILALFKTAWDRRLLFTVGHSTTLGARAGTRVTWNGIHMKTALHGEHGFPDLTYLARVRDELAAFGITEQP